MNRDMAAITRTRKMAELDAFAIAFARLVNADDAHLNKAIENIDQVHVSSWRQVFVPLLLAARNAHQSNKALRAELVTLRARLDALERAPRGLTYSGTWQRSALYQRHAGVSHHGSVWCVVVDETRSEPGSSRDWQLVVKRGADGRDMRLE